MSADEKYKLFCPSNLAYGERGRGADIGPNSVLIFEVELLSFEPPKTPGSPIKKRPEPKTEKGHEGHKH